MNFCCSIDVRDGVPLILIVQFRDHVISSFCRTAVFVFKVVKATDGRNPLSDHFRTPPKIEVIHYVRKIKCVYQFETMEAFVNNR